MALRDDVAARLKKLMAVTDDLEVVAEAIIPLVRAAERERCAATVAAMPRDDGQCSDPWEDGYIEALENAEAAIRALEDE